MLPVIYGNKVTSKYIFINYPYTYSHFHYLYIFLVLGLLYTSVALVSGSLMAIYHYKLMKNPTKEFAWKAIKLQHLI